jgi:hypothetical protein
LTYPYYRMSECTSNTRISLNMQVAHVALYLSRIIADQVCKSTYNRLQLNLANMKQEVQWNITVLFHVDVVSCYV